VDQSDGSGNRDVGRLRRNTKNTKKRSSRRKTAGFLLFLFRVLRTFVHFVVCRRHTRSALSESKGWLVLDS